MGWRTVVVNKNCKLSYKNDFLIIRSEELQMIHLSEINTIIVENGMVSITSYLINELVNNKIKLIFCDEKRNPCCETVPYYGSYNTSKKVLKQINWKQERKDLAWQQLIKIKIHNQAMLLKKYDIKGYEKLLEYEFNQFNLSCDIIEVFRPIVDEIVYNNQNLTFNKEYKYKLIDIFNRVIEFEGKRQYLSNAVPIFLTYVFNFIENDKESKIINYEF